MTSFNPPPAVTPRRVPGARAMDGEILRPFIGHYICVWLKTRRRFWFCPEAVGPDVLVGYVWRGRSWARGGVSLRMIDSIY